MRLSRLVSSLVMLAVLGPVPEFIIAAEPADAAGLVWSAGPANQPPVDWVWKKSASPQAAVVFSNDTLQLRGEPSGANVIQRPLANHNGSDEQPLAITCAIAAVGTGALTKFPAVMMLRWGDKNLIAVGLADHHDRKGKDAITWGGWLIDGKRGEARGTVEPYQRESQTQVRILVMSKVILAQASRDGYDWRTVTTHERTGALAQAPTALALGHGWLRPDALDGQLDQLDDQAKADKEKANTEKAGNPVPPSWHFSGLRVTQVSNDLPAALTKTYQRKESGEETRDAIYESTFPSEWRVAGPYSADKNPVAEAGPDAAGVTWKAVPAAGKTLDRSLHLDEVVAGGGAGAVCYARFGITCEQPRLERFLFDGVREATLFVNGRQLAMASSTDERPVQIDRLGAVTWLRSGENSIVIKVVAGPGKGESRVVVRHEPGDPRYRVAVLKRLLTDFPSEAGLMAAERTEIARAWEASGNLVAAAAAYGLVISTETAAEIPAEDVKVDAVVAAHAARARLHATMRDDVAQAADISALAEVWAKDGADRLTSVLRGARLQTLLNRNDLAVQTLDEALTKAGPVGERLPLLVERMRLNRALKQEDRVLADMQALVSELPASDPRRIALLATSARLATPAGKTPNFSAVKAAALASRRPDELHLAALAALGAGDQAGAKVVAKVMVEVCADADPLLIFAAETCGEETLQRGALQRYLSAAGVPVVDQEPLADVRQRVLRTRLSREPLGVTLLADADAIKLTSTPKALSDAGPAAGGRVWKGIGPFSNENFRRYDQPPVNPAAPDLAAKIEDRAWRDLTPDKNETIDFNAIGMGADQSVVILTTEVLSQVAGESILSCGADDSLVVWCNGAKVYEDRMTRGLTPDSLKIPLALKAGSNRITVMVQNGGGGFAFQGRLRDAPYPAIDLARILGAMKAPASATNRSEVANALLALSAGLNAESRPEGLLLAVTVLDVFPELLPQGIEAATQIFGACLRRGGATINLQQVLTWLQRARLAGLSPERGDFWRDLPFFGGELLRRIGAHDAALELVQHALVIDPEPYAQARNQLQLAAVYRFAGSVRTALPIFMRVIEDPALGPDDARWAREQVSLLRRIKNDLVPLTPPFEAATAARALVRLTAARDYDGLVAAAQKLIESFPDLALPEANGVGRSGWVTAVDALRRVGAPAIDVYRTKFQTRAEGQLLSAIESGEPGACERVARRFPLCTTRGPALLRAAEWYRDRGDFGLARGTAALAVTELSEATLQARAKALATAVALTNAATAQVPPAALRIEFPFAPTDIPELVRFPNRSTASIPALIAGTVVLHHGDAAWGIDATTGLERWRQTGTPAAAEPFNGLPFWQPGCDGDLLAVRLRAPDKRLAVVGLDPRTGIQLWTSSGIPELAGLAAVSSPTVSGQQVYAAFGDMDGNRRVVAFGARDGQVLWLTEIPGRGVSLPMIGEMDLRVAGHGAPPKVVGRELYWCSDAGIIVRLDAGNGGLMWVAPYQRAVIDPQDGVATLNAIATRGPSRIALTSEALVVAPRDCLSVLALDRVTGATRWVKSITAVSELVGIAVSSGATTKPSCIAQDDGLSAFDAADGTLLWHVPSMPVSGTALVEPGSIFAASEGAVLRIDPATGKILSRTPSPEGVREGSIVRAGKARLSSGRMTSGDGVIVNGSTASTKPTQLALAQGPALAFSALPVQESGPAWGVAATWNGGPLRAILAPPAGTRGNKTEGGERERYVQSTTWLARIESGAQPRVVWQTPIDGEAQTWAVTNMAIVGLQNGTATFYDRATGRRLATVATGITAPQNVGGGEIVSVGPEALTCLKGGWTAIIEVRDPATGSLWHRFEYAHSVGATTVRDGKILTIRNDEGVVLDIRDAHTGAQSPLVKLPFDNCADMRVHALDADRWVVGKGQRTIVINLHTAVITDAETPWQWNDQGFKRSFSLGDLTAVYREDWNHGFSAVYDSGNKTIFKQEHTKVAPAFFNDHAVVQQVDNGKLAMVAVEYRTGKTRWRFERDREWERWPKALLPWGDKTVLVSQRRDGWQRYDVVGSDGKLLASGNLAGQSGGPVIAEMVGPHLWVGSSAGLSIIAPCAVDAAKAQPLEAAVPVAERTVRDFNANFLGPQLESSSDTISIDGDVAEWPDVAPREATAADHRTASTPGVARISSVRLRSTYDAKQVAFAVEVTESTGAPVRVRLGLDARGDDGERPPVVVLGLEQVDGVTRVRVVDGAWDKAGDAGAAAPSARAMRTLNGWRFEIGIPWPLLRSKVEWRPGDRRWLRYGLLVEAPGDAVEFGHGLSSATDWTLWPGLNLLSESKRSTPK